MEPCSGAPYSDYSYSGAGQPERDSSFADTAQAKFAAAAAVVQTELDSGFADIVRNATFAAAFVA